MQEVVTLLIGLLVNSDYLNFCKMLAQEAAGELHTIFVQLHKNLIMTCCRTNLFAEELEADSSASCELFPTFRKLCLLQGQYSALGKFEYYHPLQLFN
mmetsp:Transcript_5904/g.9592  ORF Transcript_5904/g.9592 Transcript_5904/m.9592 type:complete len:98 (+) Transcript_5904:942-1235(+)